MTAEGLIALVGGDEFRPQSEPVDRLLLERLGGPERAAVAIVPTAAANERPDLAAEDGVRHFRSLGAQVDAVMALDRLSADDPRLAERLADVNLVYLTGGDPVHLLRSLSGSKLWGSILSLQRAGAVLAGSSAGAMVLGEAMYYHGWHEGLGLVRSVVVLPHYSEWEDKVTVEIGPALRGRGLVALGIDAATACVGNGDEWLVAGAGSVTLVGRSGRAVYGPGESLRLSTLRQ